MESEMMLSEKGYALLFMQEARRIVPSEYLAKVDAAVRGHLTVKAKAENRAVAFNSDDAVRIKQMREDGQTLQQIGAAMGGRAASWVSRVMNHPDFHKRANA